MFSLNQEMLFDFYGKHKNENVPPENNMHHTKHFRSKEKLGLSFQTADPSTHPPYVIGKTLNSPKGSGLVFTKNLSFLVEFNEY